MMLFDGYLPEDGCFRREPFVNEGLPFDGHLIAGVVVLKVGLSERL